MCSFVDDWLTHYTATKENQSSENISASVVEYAHAASKKKDKAAKATSPEDR